MFHLILNESKFRKSSISSLLRLIKTSCSTANLADTNYRAYQADRKHSISDLILNQPTAHHLSNYQTVLSWSSLFNVL